MRNTIIRLKKMQGIFSSVAEDLFFDSYPVNYIGIAHNKQNLRSDMQHISAAVRKAADEAHAKTSKSPFSPPAERGRYAEGSWVCIPAITSHNLRNPLI